MPSLPLEPFVFPGDLLSDPANGWENSGRWWVLHTRPRAEKSLARNLLGRTLPFFLPLHKRQWRSPGRRLLCSYVPLFSGYVFLRGDHEARLVALETRLVARVLAVEDQLRLHADLARVYHLITAGLPLTPEEQLNPGTLVEIISGPLAGLEGKILRRGKHLKFFVEVQFLQRGVSAEVEGWMIRPLAGQRSAVPLAAGRR
jgi:transcription antitermination factor NusG